MAGHDEVHGQLAELVLVLERVTAYLLLTEAGLSGAGAVGISAPLDEVVRDARETARRLLDAADNGGLGCTPNWGRPPATEPGS